MTKDARKQDWDLSDDEVQEWLFKLTQAFGDDIVTLNEMRVLYFLYAVEVLGTMKDAADALGVETSTPWRWLKNIANITGQGTVRRLLKDYTDPKRGRKGGTHYEVPVRRLPRGDVVPKSRD